MFELIFHPDSPRRQRLAFTISEADLDDAVDYGRADASTPLEQRLRETAYHMVLELRVCRDVQRVAGEPWVLLCGGRIIARNFLAASVTEEDLDC